MIRMTTGKCKAYYKYLEKHRGDWERLDQICENGFDEMRSSFRYMDFCEKHGFSYENTTKTQLRPLIMLESKPELFTKAIKRVRNRLNEGENLTQTQVRGITRVVRGIPELPPSKSNQTSVAITKDFHQQIKQLITETGHKSVTEFVNDAIIAYIQTRKTLLGL